MTGDGRPSNYLVRGGRVPPGDLMRAAAASVLGGVTPVTPETSQHDRFVLKICTAFEDGPESMFSADDIATALRAGLWGDDTGGGPFGHAKRYVIPRWEARIGETLGLEDLDRVISIDIDEESFENNASVC